MSQQLALHAAIIAFNMVQVANKVDDEFKRTIALIEGGSVFLSLVDGDGFKDGDSSVARIWAGAITGASLEILTRLAMTQLQGASRKEEEVGCGMCPKCKEKGITIPQELKEVIDILREYGDVEVRFIDIEKMAKSKIH